MRIAVGLVDADRERPRERGEGGLAVGTSRAPRLRLDLYLDSSHRGPGLVRDRADDDATRVVVGAGAGRERGGNQEILAHPELPPALAGPARMVHSPGGRHTLGQQGPAYARQYSNRG